MCVCARMRTYVCEWAVLYIHVEQAMHVISHTHTHTALQISRYLRATIIHRVHHTHTHCTPDIDTLGLLLSTGYITHTHTHTALQISRYLRATIIHRVHHTHTHCNPDI